jgi:hypothetical protein
MEYNLYLGPIKVEQETLHRTTANLERTVLLMNIRKETLYFVSVKSWKETTCLVCNTQREIQ